MLSESTAQVILRCLVAGKNGDSKCYTKKSHLEGGDVLVQTLIFHPSSLKAAP